MLKLIFLVSVRSFWLVIVTWLQLAQELVNWHADMFWRFILWTVNFTTLPVRALGALQREKMMERLLQEMQSELDNVTWDINKREAHLQMAIKERHLMESMLGEIEEEHDEAIAKIENLQREVQHLRLENFRLREVQNKGLWDARRASKNMGDEQNKGTRDRFGIPYGIPWQSSENENDLLSDKDHGPGVKQASTGPNLFGLVDPLTPLIFSRDVDFDEALDQRREIALSQSFFSAILSLLVGAIIWEAEDPCMPLVMALFTVVGLSLRSVVQFFSTIKNRPATDAVALLSFNWFILGTLTYPTLPRVAHMLSPVVAAFLDRLLSWLGLGSW